MIKQFFYRLMTDKIRGPIAAPVKALLWCVSIIYGAAIAVRGIFYKIGIFKSKRVYIKVVSVGNLTLGGTGKTPFTIALCGLIHEHMKKEPCVVIRGYGWDEQAMLKKVLKDFPILVGEDRAKSCERAVRLYGSSVAVLDDGFQHWELSRDLDIVLVDAALPLGNGCLFPRGILREPKGALKRAHVVVLTRADRKGADISGVRNMVLAVNPRATVICAVHRPLSFYDTKTRKDYPVSAVDGKRVALVSSIGDPDYFTEMVSSLGAQVVRHVVFDDHHNYHAMDVEHVMEEIGHDAPEMIITTEKDIVKLNRMSLSFGSYRLMVLDIVMDITQGKEELCARLDSVYPRPRVK